MNKQQKWLSFRVAGIVSLMSSLMLFYLGWHMYLKFGYSQDTKIFFLLGFMPLLGMSLVLLIDKDLRPVAHVLSKRSVEAPRAEEPQEGV